MQVGQVAVAIAKGNRADEEIETYIGLDSGGRQGRYYRLAAETLGLITNQHNFAVLTPLGEEFSTLGSAQARLDFLARCLVETPVFHEALRYIHDHSPTDQQLKLWFRSFYPGAKNTADRRFHTFLSYLRDADLLRIYQAKYKLHKYAGSVVRQTVPAAQGLAGRKLTKLPTKPTSTAPKGVIRVDVDAQKLERANQIHWQLVNAKSTYLDARGYEPYENEHIDVYADAKGDVILYEMKSLNPEGNNLLPQVRKAVAQLYEYRYIFEEPKARLCIVTNQGIAKKDEWLLDYLIKDRSIAYEWTEDFINFQCRNDASSLLGSYSP